MSDAAESRAPFAASSRPRLASFVRVQHDTVRERWVLQAPERILELDESGKAIVDRCDGRATFEDVVSSLVAAYDAPRDIIEHDVRAVLTVLYEKGFVELSGDERS